MSRRVRRARRRAHRRAIARGWMWAHMAQLYGPPRGYELRVSVRHLVRGFHAFTIHHARGVAPSVDEVERRYETSIDSCTYCNRKIPHELCLDARHA